MLVKIRPWEEIKKYGPNSFLSSMNDKLPTDRIIEVNKLSLESYMWGRYVIDKKAIEHIYIADVSYDKRIKKRSYNLNY